VLLTAAVVAALHGLAVVFMVTGALLALRWPRVVLVHAPVALAVLGVNLAGADCPLTVLEEELRARAGAGGLDGGFLGHYLFDPLGVDVRATATQVGIYAVALPPNLIGYGLLAARTVGRVAARRS
jgi:hypothetical protein